MNLTGLHWLRREDWLDGVGGVARGLMHSPKSWNRGWGQLAKARGEWGCAYCARRAAEMTGC